MRLDQMRVDGVHGGRVDSVSDFSVRPGTQKQVTGRTLRTAAKVGVCALALFGAFALRWMNVEQTMVAASVSMDTPLATDAPGSLRFADRAAKMPAPVQTNDVELLREQKIIRFTAADTAVCAGIGGTVEKTGKDDRYGNYLRLKGENGTKLILYGFESFSVQKGDSAQAGDTLGTVPIGRSVYLAIEQDGTLIDPSFMVDLTIYGKSASV